MNKYKIYKVTSHVNLFKFRKDLLKNCSSGGALKTYRRTIEVVSILAINMINNLIPSLRV